MIWKWLAGASRKSQIQCPTTKVRKQYKLVYRRQIECRIDASEPCYGKTVLFNGCKWDSKITSWPEPLIKIIPNAKSNAAHLSPKVMTSPASDWQFQCRKIQVHNYTDLMSGSQVTRMFAEFLYLRLQNHVMTGAAHHEASKWQTHSASPSVKSQAHCPNIQVVPKTCHCEMGSSMFVCKSPESFMNNTTC